MSATPQPTVFMVLVATVIIGTITALLCSFFIQRKAKHLVLIKLGLTIIDLMSELEFISAHWTDKSISRLLLVWLLSVFACFLVNLLFLRVFLSGILSNAEFLQIFLKYRLLFFLVVVMGCIDLDCIFFLNSNLFGISFTSEKTLDLMTLRNLEMAAGVSTLFENVPQLIVAFLIWNVSTKYFKSRSFLVCLVCIICDLLFGLSRVCLWSAIPHSTLEQAATENHRRKNPDLYRGHSRFSLSKPDFQLAQEIQMAESARERSESPSSTHSEGLHVEAVEIDELSLAKQPPVQNPSRSHSKTRSQSSYVISTSSPYRSASHNRSQSKQSTRSYSSKRSAHSKQSKQSYSSPHRRRFMYHNTSRSPQSASSALGSYGNSLSATSPLTTATEESLKDEPARRRTDPAPPRAPPREKRRPAFTQRRRATARVPTRPVHRRRVPRTTLPRASEPIIAPIRRRREAVVSRINPHANHSGC